MLTSPPTTSGPNSRRLRPSQASTGSQPSTNPSQRAGRPSSWRRCSQRKGAIATSGTATMKPLIKKAGPTLKPASHAHSGEAPGRARTRA